MTDTRTDTRTALQPAGAPRTVYDHRPRPWSDPADPTAPIECRVCGDPVAASHDGTIYHARPDGHEIAARHAITVPPQHAALVDAVADVVADALERAGTGAGTKATADLVARELYRRRAVKTTWRPGRAPAHAA